MAARRIRSMTAPDVEPLVASILADDWGDRRSWFAFALESPACRVFVADDDAGRAIGSAVLTIHGTVGWIGTIWVAPTARRSGIGSDLTGATIEAADTAGCRTLLLVATDAGRPMYERLGFRVQTWYRTMETPPDSGQDPDGRPDPAIRAFRPTDLPSLIELDRVATGEDRAINLERLATPDGTRVLEREGAIVGFVARAPWGGGATVAPRLDDAMAILDARRLAAHPGRRVRCGILLENEAGADALEVAGWTEAWRAPRMIRGDGLDWRPEHIWGQFNHAMG
jgi:GNAT superfamily N-acetyltransferase